MLLFTKLNKEANAEKRSSSQKLENRELPGGARQSEVDCELTLEQLTEGLQGLCRCRRNTRRKKGKGMLVPLSAWCLSIMK